MLSANCTIPGTALIETALSGEFLYSNELQFVKKCQNYNFNSWTTSKIELNFWQTDPHWIHKIKWFPLRILLLSRPQTLLLKRTHHLWTSTTKLRPHTNPKKCGISQKIIKWFCIQKFSKSVGLYLFWSL